MSKKRKKPMRGMQTILNEAIKSRKTDKLLSYLSSLEINQDLVNKLAEQMRRAGGLIYVRPDSAGQKSRDDLLSDIKNKFIQSSAELDIKTFEDACRIIRIAESGYHLILESLKQTDFSKLGSAKRAAAIVARMEANLADLRAKTEAALIATKKLMVPSGADLPTADGKFVSSDAIVSGMVSSLGGTLMMEGYANGWFDNQGRLVLPKLPPVSDKDIFLAGSSEYLAMSWRKWEHLEQTARFENTDIIELTGEDVPEDHKSSVQLILRREGVCQTHDFIANERASDREYVSAFELRNNFNADAVRRSVEKAVAAAPKEWVSLEELINTISLSEALGYHILKDEKKYGGLKLSQWIRGYATLSAWVEVRQEAGSKGLIEISPNDLKALLRRASLSKVEADQFIDFVSYGRGSRDLFDAPLVRTEGDWLLIGPALAAPRLATIIPSMLASKKIQIERKGKEFEARVIDMLTQQGLKPKLVKVNREQEEYDFDVLLEWDEYIFHFECKNHGLSGNDPAQAYFFLKELEDNLEQVARLRGALAKWPDILTEAFGAEASTKTVIHCILENQTFCFPGAIDGIYVYDWSSLSRFFKEGWLNIIQQQKIGEQIVQKQVGLKKIWSGDRPTPGDLLAEMNSPSQFRVIDHHIEVSPSYFYLDRETLACDFTLSRRRPTNQSMASAHGIVYENFAKEVALAEAQINEIKENFKRADIRT